MKIAFFGIPDLGIICLNTIMASKKNVIMVVPPAAVHPSHSVMVNTANSYGIPSVIFQKTPKEKDFINKFREYEPDVAVVASYNNLIPQELLEIPKYGFINCHPALLPNYRGGNPYFHVIYNGESKTGTTIHYMDNSFDTGDIILQEEMKIEANDTLGLLFNKLNHQGARLLNDVLTRLDNGETLPRIPQDKNGSYKTAPNIGQDEESTFIDWNTDACHIESFVRGLNPFFGAKSYFRNCKVRFWSGLYNLSSSKSYTPGTIVNVTKDNIAIATKEGFFVPTSLQLEYFLITDIKDFIKRTNPKVGEIFTVMPV